MIGLLRKKRDSFLLLKKALHNMLHAEFYLRKRMLEYNMLHNTKPGITDERYCDHDIIVSLTTHGKRLYEVYLAIESVMEQTMKANRIVLWLDYGFEGKLLPRTLQMQQKRGLEIRYCKDIKSYKKLIPALQEFPDAVIITIDDDAIYNLDTLEQLITAYVENPSYIYCHRQHKIKLHTTDNKLLPYDKWEKGCVEVGCAHPRNFPVGVGGILYPPHIFDGEVFNETVFMKICPYADDIWFKAMALKNGILSQKVHTHNPEGNDFIENINVQDVGLKEINTEKKCLNNTQAEAVFSRYGLHKKLL